MLRKLIHIASNLVVVFVAVLLLRQIVLGL